MSNERKADIPVECVGLSNCTWISNYLGIYVHIEFHTHLFYHTLRHTYLSVKHITHYRRLSNYLTLTTACVIQMNVEYIHIYYNLLVKLGSE